MAQSNTNLITKTLKVLKRSDKILSYVNKTNQREMKYFNVVAAEGEVAYRIRVYQVNKLNMLQTGLSFKFHNMVAKGDKEYWITSNSTLAYSATVETSLTDSCELQLPEKIAPEGEKKTLASALASPDKSSVLGKVVQVSPLKYRQGGSLPVRALILKDSQTTAKVCLFGGNAEMQFEEGNMVNVSAVYPKKYLNRDQLTTSPISTCQFTADDPTILVQQQDANQYLSDPDFEEDLDEPLIEDIILTDFTEFDVYKCCEVKACRQKKMVGNQCPVCKATTSNLKSYRIAFLYSTEKAKDKKITLFKSTIEKILKVELDLEEQKSSLISVVVDKLPIRVRASISAGNNLYNIQ
ncbi:uncharacterized protein LOC117342277 [Pecten maximus]|uniref:uncharacterized protein LOC117321427 n=1 Tax=Pecten maximus TaxID=6579 RepID=UPI0014587A4D|nr:uncharacterized protein LOC117321427 [Pecten maximus]XP_033760262.1 uncharacterized protein LOC117342277 [Pecten maximus]